MGDRDLLAGFPLRRQFVAAAPESPSIAVEDVAGTRTPLRRQVVGVEQLAHPQGETATADAPTTAVSQSFEHGDPGVDTGAPGVGQLLPVLLVWSAALWQ